MQDVIGTSNRPPRLLVEKVNKRFGGLQALSNVGLQIDAGQIYGLIGPNGAGKSTFFNTLTGWTKPDSGVFTLDGHAYEPKIDEVAKAGIARTFQNLRLFEGLSVLENVMVGRHARTREGLIGAIFKTQRQRQEEHAIRAHALALLHYVGLAKYADAPAGSLSYGHQRRLEIARALAGEPKLLALDEPCAGMNPAEKIALQKLLRKICSPKNGLNFGTPASSAQPGEVLHKGHAEGEGISILLIEHDVQFVTALCDQITVLDYGQVIAQGPPQILLKNPKVIEAYLGASASTPSITIAATPTSSKTPPANANHTKQMGHHVTNPPPLLRIQNLHLNYGAIQAVKGINLEIYPGEQIALIGANGAGKSTTLKGISGLKNCVRGEMYYQGVSIRNVPPHKLLERGLAMVPEGRGIFSRMTVLDNLNMGAYLRCDTAQVLRDKEKIFDFFPRLKERLSQMAGTLSGGEQQMLAIARALLRGPELKLLLLDEPSMGLSPLMRETIFEVLPKIPEQGTAVLIVEQNAHLALSIADRAYVMESGRITMEGEAQSLLSDPKVREAYLGA